MPVYGAGEADGVAYLHSRGILHRDLKPANILLASGVASAPRGSDATEARTRGADATPLAGRTRGADATPLAHWTPKVADFGLAKSLDAEGGDTGSFAVVGTAAYMAPEQAAGTSRDLSTAADIYSLGTILYELLVGRPPFGTGNANDLLRRVVHETPALPRSLRRDVPRDLETICLKCLEKEPRRRYASAAALADDLRHWREHRPIAARRAGAAERVLLWCRRGPARAAAVVLGAAAVVALAALAVASAFVVQQTQVNKALDEARGRAERTRAQLALEQGLTQCRQGDPAGILRLAQALKQLPPGHPDLEHVLRANLGAWGRGLSAPRAFLAVPGEVTSVAFRPDGQVLLTGSQEKAGPRGEVRLWDAATGELRLRLPLEALVACAALRPDGTAFAAALRTNTTRTVCQWDAASAAPLGPPLPHPDLVTGLAYSPDGRLLLTACLDGRARLYEAATGRLLRSVEHRGKVTAVAFRPDGRWLATASGAHAPALAAVRLWETDTGTPVGDPVPQSGDVTALAFSPDGAQVVAAAADQTTRQWEAAIGRQLRSAAHAEPIRSLGFSPDGRMIVTGFGNLPRRQGETRLWDAETGRPAGFPLWHRGHVLAVGVSPDGRTVITGGADGAWLWDAAPGAFPERLLVQKAGLKSLALAAGDRRFVVGGGDWYADRGLAAVATTRTEIGPGFRHPAAVRSLAFADGGRTFLTAGDDRTVRVWAVPLPCPWDAERAVAWAEVVTGIERGDDETVRLLSADEWQRRRQRLRDD